MAPTPSIEFTMNIPGFKGSSKLVSNRYHFSGGTPADGTAWLALANDIHTTLQAATSSDVGIGDAKGYTAGSDVAVFTHTFNDVGSISSSGKTETPAFVCALLRWSTAARSTKNHPVYLFNYMHGVFQAAQTGVGIDEVESSQLTAIRAFVQKWWDTGFTDGTNTYHRAGPNGATATGGQCDGYLYDHDLSPR